MWVRFFIAFLFSVTLFAHDFSEVILRHRELLTFSLMKVSFQKLDNSPFQVFPGDYIELRYPKHWETRMYSVSEVSPDQRIISVTVSISPHRPMHPHVSEELSTAKILKQKCHIKEMPTGIWTRLQENPDVPLIVIAGGLASSRGECLMKALGGNDCRRRMFFIHTHKRDQEYVGHEFLKSLEFYVEYETFDGMERIHQQKPAFLEQFIFPDALYLISGPDRTKKSLGTFEDEIRDWLIKRVGISEENIILSTWDQE